MKDSPSIESAHHLLLKGRAKEAIAEASDFVRRLLDKDTHQIQRWKSSLDIGLSRLSFYDNQLRDGLITFEQYSAGNNQIVYSVSEVIQEIMAIFGKDGEETEDEDSNSIIRHQLENSSWYLYSFNYPHGSIVKAILRIRNISGDENRVKLENPPILFPYVGVLDVKHARQHTFVLKLVKNNKLKDSHLHIVFFSDLRSRDRNNYCLGQLIGFGDHKSISSCNIILERIESQDDPEAEIFEGNGKSKLGGENLHSAIVNYVNPFSATPRISPRPEVIKTLSDLEAVIVQL